MEGREVAGLMLIVAGIAWMFLAQLGYLRRRRTAAAAAGVASSLPDVIGDIVKRLPLLMLPGALMVLVGAMLMLGGEAKEEADAPSAVRSASSST